jgi:methyltransferase (TIGR00027 family)
MEKNQASLTALLTAFVRAYHYQHDSPQIFEDPLARSLFTAEEYAAIGQNLADSLQFFAPGRAASCRNRAEALAWVIQTTMNTTLSRSRYAEDALEAALETGVDQYVILGAGMDTFAFRRPEIVERLQVLEIDHPATQAAKRERIARAGWEQPAQLHFLPVDLAAADLATAVRGSAYDPRKLTFFSWLGVTLYLPRPAVWDTLRAMAAIAPAGSTVVFDYLDTDAFAPGRTSLNMVRVQEIVRRVGEPMQAGLDPSTLAADLSVLGWSLRENLDPAAIEDRYFRGRSDQHHASEHLHYARAVRE